MKKVTIKITPELEEVLSTIRRKDTRDSLLQIYNALIYKDNKYNKVDRNEFFPIPSTYLEKFRSRYYKYIDMLLDNNIIEYKSLNSTILNEEEIFEVSKFKRNKYYNTNLNQCMSYRFLINTDKGRENEIEIDNNVYQEENWYKITYSSLSEFFTTPRLIRDSFSRRLHTNITANTHIDGFESYKTLFNAAVDSYYNIDIVACQPTLLYNYMLENNYEVDVNYNSYTIYDLIDTDRNIAKKKFVTFLNCDIDKMDRDIMKLYPKVSKFIIAFKTKNGSKSLAALLQRIESDIVIDDLLENIVEETGIDFCMTVHDSLICKEEDSIKVLEYCENKYPELKFKEELL